MCAKTPMSANEKGLAETGRHGEDACPCLPMGAKPNRLAQMSSLAHMGRAKRLQRVLAPYWQDGEPIVEKL